MKEKKVKGTRGIISRVEGLEGLIFVDGKKLLKEVFKKHGKGPLVPKKKEKVLEALFGHMKPLPPLYDYPKIRKIIEEKGLFKKEEEK